MTEEIATKERFWRRRVPRWRWAVWSILGIVALVSAFTIRDRMSRFAAASTPEDLINGKVSGGTLVIAGGGELPMQVQQKFVELAGAQKARIVVIPAVKLDESLREHYLAAWKAMQPADVQVLHTTDRAEADDPAFSAVLDEATGVWIGGGSQTSLVTWYGRTLVEKRIRAVLERNGVVGGTSAGAAIMSERMIAGGRDGRNLSRGFGLWPGVVVDQHFMRRNRWARLYQAIASGEPLTGIGIDEETAIIVERGTGKFVVLGKSYVMAMVAAIDSQPIRIEILKSGDMAHLSDLKEGRPLGPSPTDFDSLLIGE
ncbi:MAG: cyanophycinase [Planctomycetaceae bacterium]|nr:cyanophycinase [Planctomycetaceae bacterium]